MILKVNMFKILSNHLSGFKRLEKKLNSLLLGGKVFEVF